MRFSRIAACAAALAAVFPAAQAWAQTADAAAEETTFGSNYLLTDEERATFGRAIAACWQVDPSYAMVKVDVRIHLDERGHVIDNNVEILRLRGGDDVSQSTAYEAVRTAILRCEGRGYPLPADRYDAWKVIEMTFDGTSMVQQN